MNPKEAGAARGAQTYLEKQAVPLVLGVDGAEPVLVLLMSIWYPVSV